MTLSTLKIGTRGSPLALKQAHTMEALVKAAHPDLQTEIVIITTSGDWKPEDGETRLAEERGGKGLFARELEQAMLKGEIDCAVHSTKDMESFLPEGLALDHFLERENPQDAFICHSAKSFMDLPKGAVIGTSSMRRQAFVQALRPDLQMVPLRGNVQTRLDKLANGQVDATFLAMAGLNRLNITGDFIHPVNWDLMLPACGQGIIGIETREDDAEVRYLLDAIHHELSGVCAMAERSALQLLDGSCRSAIGAYARLTGKVIRLDVHVADVTQGRLYRDHDISYVGSLHEATDLGIRVAERLKETLPPYILE